MKSINEDIVNGQFKQVYLLYGEEAYLRNQYRDKLKVALISDGDAMNYHYFEGKNVSVLEVIDLAETMPFLAERRVIILENAGLLKHGGEELAEYLVNMCETAFIVITEAEIDKRSKLFKAIKNYGRVVEFPVQDENTLKRWVLSILKKEGKTISEAGLNELLMKTGTDMENIRKELEKLICYTMGRDIITGEDIEAICITRVHNQIFDMVNAIADKKQKLALKLYYDLLALKEPPMRILFLIARQYNLLLQVKELKGKGYDNRIISEKAGLHPYVAGKYVTQAGKFSGKALGMALEKCVEFEEAVKTGQINDVMSIELLIVSFSR